MVEPQEILEPFGVVVDIPGRRIYISEQKLDAVDDWS